MRLAIAALTSALSICAATDGAAQITRLLPPTPPRSIIYNYVPADTVGADTIRSGETEEGLMMFFDDDVVDPDDGMDLPETLPPATQLRPYQLRPVVFDHIRVFGDSLRFDAPRAVDPGYADPYAFDWINEEILRTELLTRAKQHYIVNNPGLVMYNEKYLPEPPKHYTATIDPETASIVLKEVIALEAPKPELETEIKRRHWLRRFSGDLQFSQAYVSPNWYQGGNKNLNLLANLIYKVSLNQKFYPKYLFEAVAQYKLGINNAPDDTVRSVHINEDLFQVNVTAGMKAAKNWYYSANLMFKTQVFDHYPTNSRQIQSALMSPGELNIGLGMTYNRTSANKRFSLNASLSPATYNLKTCLHSDVDPTRYNIKKNRRLANKFGSSADINLNWKVAYNINYSSRLFIFSDYEYFQGDWQHTIDCRINRYLTTSIYANMRYDTRTPRCDDDPKWHKFQFKEILSFGIAYHFGTI